MTRQQRLQKIRNGRAMGWMARKDLRALRERLEARLLWLKTADVEIGKRDA